MRSLTLAALIAVCSAAAPPKVSLSYSADITLFNGNETMKAFLAVLASDAAPGLKTQSIDKVLESDSNGQTSVTIPQNQCKRAPQAIFQLDLILLRTYSLGNQSTSFDFNSSGCYYDCKNGTGCGPNWRQERKGVQSFLIDSLQAPPPPPPPSSACAAAISVLFVDPFIVLQLSPSKNMGVCGSSTKGELWVAEIGPPTAPANYDFSFCIATSGSAPIPLYTDISVSPPAVPADAETQPPSKMSAKIMYENFKPGPPSSTFDPPPHCKCS
jgi:hypothetical protein